MPGLVPPARLSGGDLTLPHHRYTQDGGAAGLSGPPWALGSRVSRLASTTSPAAAGGSPREDQTPVNSGLSR